MRAYVLDLVRQWKKVKGHPQTLCVLSASVWLPIEYVVNTFCLDICAYFISGFAAGSIADDKELVMWLEHIKNCL